MPASRLLARRGERVAQRRGFSRLSQPRPGDAGTTAALLDLHRLLFPERYGAAAVGEWTNETLASVDCVVREAPIRPGVEWERLARVLEDADDLGSAATLDAFADELERACDRLEVKIPRP